MARALNDRRKKSLEIQQRLTNLFEPLKDGRRADPEFPDLLDLAEPDLAIEILELLEAVDWKWTISEILEQPRELFKDVLYLRHLGLEYREYRNQ